MKKRESPPFFIIGCNRSGTSLLRTMLNHHSCVAVPLESIFLIDYMLTRNKDMNKKINLIIHEPMLAEWGLKLKKDDFKDVKTTKDLFDVVHVKYALKQGKKVWGNKTPRFTRYSLRLKKLYPGAKFIHILRDPRGVSLSLSKSRIHASNVYFGAMRWRRYVQAGLALEKKYPKDVLRIYYEDLITKPERVLKRVCKFLGISWEKQMLNYMADGNNEYRSFHRLEHAGLRSRPNEKKVDSWKSEISSKQLSVVDSLCFNIMRKIGYKNLSRKRKVDIYTKSYYMVHRGYTFVGQITHYILYWPDYVLYTFYRKLVLATFTEDVKVTYQIGYHSKNG